MVDTAYTPDNSSNKGPEIKISIYEVQVEHHRDAIGIGEPSPRLSWKISTDAQNWIQSAYEIELLEPSGLLKSRSARIASTDSVLVPWPFAPLTSRQRVQVRIRVFDQLGRSSEWSEPTPIETGLLHATDWTSQFITPDWAEDLTCAQPCPMLRREFELGKDIIQARLYITALGVYEAQINGDRIGDSIMPPGWTSYPHRLRYQTYDVTSQIHVGWNAIGVTLGDGWYRGRLGFGGGIRNTYGDRLALLAQLEVYYVDGSVELIISNSEWRASTGPILSSDIYDGETYDARLEQSGWSSPNFDDSAWSGVHELNQDLHHLVAPVGPPVREIEKIYPITISHFTSGKYILDFGQNLVGYIHINVHGEAGRTITMRHAEVLQDGELCTRPLRTAKATDSYTLCGKGTEAWEPRFTFHGFRYAEIDGWPGEMNPQDVYASVCHSDLERTGWFECSDPLINRLHENVIWSMRGNFFDLPTDCPQRDERLGWTGDIQVFSPTASYLYDVSGFLQSWLADLAAEQKTMGGVPFVIPCPTTKWNHPAAAWGDVTVILPWVLYLRFGDLGFLEKQFESMRSWVDLIANITGDRYLWDHGFQYGDWLDPSAPPEHPGDAKTPPAIVATAYFAHSAGLVSRIAGLLGFTDEETYYFELSQKIRVAFNQEYVTPAGRVMSDSATAYALALEFALLPEGDQRKIAAERLAMLVRSDRYRINTGFVGTPLICDALCSAGYIETAYRLLMQTECPSWLYPVTMGATTIWERWDSMLPDGTINPGGMTSFNHYALGAVADWLHRSVGGLAPAAPGYRCLRIQPLINNRITWVKTKHMTPYGLAECSWSLDKDQFKIMVTIPANTSATLVLPGKELEPIEIGSGTYHWSYRYHISKSVPPALTLDSTFNQLIDVPELYTQVISLFSQYNQELVGLVKDQMEMTIRQAIDLMPRVEQLTGEFETLIHNHNS
ncbi:MAG: family 78 glycoside hydrolase catalytic domain [Anaerolineaceae bacterium]|nr:family 78 glycoside hydrolase catalytic domain [Anaerolineaceae bacterium]